MATSYYGVIVDKWFANSSRAVEGQLFGNERTVLFSGPE